jgi:integrase/recombinase XerC
MHLDNFITHLASVKRYSPHTVAAYQKDIQQFLAFVEETYEINHITAINHQMIRSWIMYLMDNDISGRSVNRKISSLKTFYRYLRKNNVIRINPMLKILPPKSKKSLPEFISNENMDLLLEGDIFEEGFEGKRDRLIIEMFYFTGIRLSELTELKNSDVNLSKCQMKVLGKRNKERVIPFGKILATSIEDYLISRTKMNGEGRPEDIFFVTKRGLKVYKKLVYRIVNSYLSKVSTLKQKSPHVLRHTFATHMLNNGADLNAIKELLGHANLSATQVYTHNTIDKLKTIYNQAHPRA